MFYLSISQCFLMYKFDLQVFVNLPLLDNFNMRNSQQVTGNQCGVRSANKEFPPYSLLPTPRSPEL